MELKNFKNQIIGYANVFNKNGAIISKRELKKCIVNQRIPIFKNYNQKELMGVTDKVWLEGNELKVSGYLIKENLKNKVLGFGMYADKKFITKKKYRLKNCKLNIIGLINKDKFAY